MKIEEYYQIVSTIRKFRGLTKDCAKMLIAMYIGVPPLALKSILNQETHDKMKNSHGVTYCNDRNNFYQQYLEAFERGERPGILLNMAVRYNTCPALLASKVLKQYVKTDKMDENAVKNKVQKMVRDTTLIPHASLAYEVYLCILYDDQYGAVSTTISDAVGKEYELKLENYLIERKIPYSNESHLRSKGYDKTPDCKLEVPIAVNGFVINWIESKAQFGSPRTHDKYINEQFLSYWNRFGPGLVIYWFGYVDNIIQPSESRFTVMDHFPENITYMDPYSISQSSL